MKYLLSMLVLSLFLCTGASAANNTNDAGASSVNSLEQSKTNKKLQRIAEIQDKLETKMAKKTERRRRSNNSVPLYLLLLLLIIVLLLLEFNIIMIIIFGIVLFLVITLMNSM